MVEFASTDSSSLPESEQLLIGHSAQTGAESFNVNFPLYFEFPAAFAAGGEGRKQYSALFGVR